MSEEKKALVSATKKMAAILAAAKATGEELAEETETTEETETE